MSNNQAILENLRLGDVVEVINHEVGFTPNIKEPLILQILKLGMEPNTFEIKILAPYRLFGYANLWRPDWTGQHTTIKKLDYDPDTVRILYGD